VTSAITQSRARQALSLIYTPTPTVDLGKPGLGRRIRLDYTNDDDTFAIARLVMIRHKQVGKSADTETETRLDVELMGNHRITVRFSRLGVVELL
jgi:hypothetical protein